MKPCSKCGEVKPADEFYRERTGRLKSQCKDCGREGRRAWKAAHPDREKEQWQRWRAKQPEGTLPYQRAWYAAQDPERIRAMQLAWKRANPERARELNRTSYMRHLDRSRARSRNQAHRRRLAKQGASTPTVEVVTALILEPCAYCGSVENIEVDHVVPLSRGGAHTEDNLAPACRPCNRSKGAKLLSEWRVAA